MKSNVTVTKQFSDSPICNICKGKYLKDGVPDQKSAKQEFGVIPNNCVTDSNGRLHCPAIRH